MGSPSDLDAQRKALCVLIDKLARRVQAICNPEAEGRLQEAVAVRLQAAVRGLLGRRQAQVLREKKRADRIDAGHAELKAFFERVRHQLAALQLQEAAAVRLQVAVRGFLARRQAREARAQFRSSAFRRRRRNHGRPSRAI
jgi:hypothetical protein